jgi:hypothetical protein
MPSRLPIPLLALAALACQLVSPNQPPASAPPGEAAHTTPIAPHAPTPMHLAWEAAQQHCAAVPLEHICLVSGQAALQARPGQALGAFSQPGQAVPLDAVESARIGAAGDGMGAALLRLRADMDEDAHGLGILVLGEVHLSGIEIARSSAAAVTPAAGSDGDDDDLLPDPALVDPLPGLSFASLPQPQADLPPSGLLLYTYPGQGMAALHLNGALLALGSVAYVQAPAGEMTISLLQGTALVQAGEGAAGLVPGAQASLPLEAGGLAGAPGQPEPIDPRVSIIAQAVAEYQPHPVSSAVAEAVAGYVPDPPASIISEAVAQYVPSLAGWMTGKYERAIRQCAQEARPRYVYNVLYWHRMLTRDSLVRQHLGQARLDQLEAQAGACLTFELDFDSTIQTSSEDQLWISRVRAQGLRFQMLPGQPAHSEPQPLEYVSFEMLEDWDECQVRTEISHGELSVTGGGLRIYGDRLLVELVIAPSLASEDLYVSCPDGNDVMVAYPVIRPHHWRNFFHIMHEGEAASGAYLIDEWWYTAAWQDAGQPGDPSESHFAEAIFEWTLDDEDVEIYEATFMVLVHAPR